MNAILRCMRCVKKSKVSTGLFIVREKLKHDKATTTIDANDDDDRCKIVRDRRITKRSRQRFI